MTAILIVFYSLVTVILLVVNTLEALDARDRGRHRAMRHFARWALLAPLWIFTGVFLLLKTTTSLFRMAFTK